MVRIECVLLHLHLIPILGRVRFARAVAREGGGGLGSSMSWRRCRSGNALLINSIDTQSDDTPALVPVEERTEPAQENSNYGGVANPSTRVPPLNCPRKKNTVRNEVEKQYKQKHD